VFGRTVADSFRNTAEHRGQKKRDRENAKERAGNIKYKGRQKYDNLCPLVNAVYEHSDLTDRGLQENKQITERKIR